MHKINELLGQIKTNRTLLFWVVVFYVLPIGLINHESVPKFIKFPISLSWIPVMLYLLGPYKITFSIKDLFSEEKISLVLLCWLAMIIGFFIFMFIRKFILS